MHGQADIWNDLWVDKSQSSTVYWRKYEVALPLLPADPFPLVDLGCGPGFFLKTLENKVGLGDARGVELSLTGIEKRACAAPIEQGSILDWRPQGRMKTAVSIDVLEHLDRPDIFLKAVREYADTLVLCCPNFNSLRQRVQVMTGAIPFQNRPARGGHVYWCQRASLLDLFDACGWQVEREYHDYPAADRSALARRLGSLRPALFANSFGFRLRPKA